MSCKHHYTIHGMCLECDTVALKQPKFQIKVELQAVYGGDREIAESAWTSSIDYQKKKSRTDEDVARVVNLLADAKHSTPFESVIFRWWLKMPVAIDRQFMTHRLQSASGQSARYRTMPSEFLEMPYDVAEILFKLDNGNNWVREYDHVCSAANDFYVFACHELKEHKDKNIITQEEYKRAREFLRGALPQHNMVERVSIMNLRSFANFYRLRSKSDAQLEIQQIAKEMKTQLEKNEQIKYALRALEKNEWKI